MSETPPRTPPGRGLKIALVVSVALNLLVAGMIGGAFLRGGPDRDLGFGPFAEALTEDDHRALRQEFMARAPDMREMRRSQRAAMRDLLSALRAEPFDPAALEMAMAAAASRMGDRLRIGQEILVRHLAAMSPADRAAFADRLEAAAARGPRHAPPGP